MERKIVRPSTQLVSCPECGAQGKIVRHTRGWEAQNRFEFIGPIQPKVGDTSKVRCEKCWHEFLLERM